MPKDLCPPADKSIDALEWLEAEPAPTGQAGLPCWETFASDTVDDVLKHSSSASLARLILAFADRSHHQAMFNSLVERLRRDVSLDSDGRIKLLSASRTDRTLVYSALLRGARVPGLPTVPADRLLGWLLVDRDASGSFGSPQSTLAAVRALLASGTDAKEDTRVEIEGLPQPTMVNSNSRSVIPLGANVSKVEIHTKGPWLIARLERPRLRLFSHPDYESTPMKLEVTWPTNIQRGVATINVVVTSQVAGIGRVDIPLPPGVTLAAPMHDVRQMQGHLVIQRSLDAGPQSIPLRFGLAGAFTAREAKIVSSQVAVRGVAPAQQLTVR